MKYEKGTENTDVVDVRGRRVTAPKLALGGIVLVLAAAIVSQLIGYDVTGLVKGGAAGGGSGSPGSAAPLDGPDPDAERVDFIKFVMKDIQDSWDGFYKGQNKQYRKATLYIFDANVKTGCGFASKDIGPFYCPVDSNAYIDLSFYKALKAKFGAPGDFAQAYVLAHEIGHHIQNLVKGEGKEPKPKAGESQNQTSVRVELQADCFAGIWAKHAQGKKLLEVGDVEEAITAAAAIGDDTLQKQAGMEVNPEGFTHGTSSQRVKWFKRGFEGGTFEACDTYASQP